MINNDDYDDTFERYEEADLEGGAELVEKSDIRDKVPRKAKKDKGLFGCTKRLFIYMYPAVKKTAYTK